MKKLIAVLFGLFLLVSLSACNEKLVTLTGDNVAETYEVKDSYDELVIENIRIRKDSVDTGAKVSVVNSDTKSLVITMQESLKNELKVSFSGKKIIISADKYTKYVSNFDVVINITGLQFKNIDISGATYCSCDDIEFNEKINYIASGASIFNMNSVIATEAYIGLSGASQFRATSLTVTNKVTVDASGASIANVKGSSDSLTSNLSGASQFRSFDFTTNTASVSLSGASHLEATVNESISGSASGASVVSYDGNGTSSVTVSGASVATHR